MRHRSIVLLFALCPPARAATGSAACAPCHADVVRSYQATPMARSARPLNASSPTPESFARNSFDHASSNDRYRITLRNGAYVLDFDNTATGLRGAKTLAYAVGSGAKAFSYLIDDGGFLYEAPVAYYSAEARWGLEPGYDQYSYPYLTRPIVPGCLNCHASFVRVQPQTLNRYADPPFAEGGVACERCHGDGGKHIAKMQSGQTAGSPEILNPANLAAPNRDSICAQCHLTGAARVLRPGADWQSFHPGDRLSDSVIAFVRSRKSENMTVTGHVESLASSACKRAAGDRLWCATCHDPHTLPAPSEKSAWFRSRCLTCHDSKPCTENLAVRTRAQDNCIGCHMPQNPAADAQHVVYTDHSIPRRPIRRPAASRTAADSELRPFDGAPATKRDLALAYAQLAVGKTTGQDGDRALRLLQETAAGADADSETLVSLAEIYRTGDKNALAEPLYRRALAADPELTSALVGLGGVLMERGADADAIALWTRALAQNAGLEFVRVNLAVAQWRSGHLAEARQTLETALRINPAFAPARDVLNRIGPP